MREKFNLTENCSRHSEHWRPKADAMPNGGTA
jgi:hypothetical protein